MPDQSNENILLVRRLRPEEAGEVAELIHFSTNYFYETRHRVRIFAGEPSDCRIFPDVYETLDPNCCVVVENRETGRLVGSCFFHPRPPTHVSIGIVNVHPSWAGKKIARRMLEEVVAFAEEVGLPVRLVSSALNLDSFALYTRSAFVPRQLYQDMLLPALPPGGLPVTGPDDDRVRPATWEDVPAIAALETDIASIAREKDWAYFVHNDLGIWRVFVCEDETGDLTGALASVAHPASRLIGPGVARNESVALALLRAQLLAVPPGEPLPVFLLPADAPAMVATAYGWGARAIELHVAQVRGEWTPPRGIVFPTFLPETG